MHESHPEISKIIENNNVAYKLRIDLKRVQEFNVGDNVMVRIRPERYPPGSIKKLHARTAGPFQILKKLNQNTFVVDLPESLISILLLTLRI